MTSLEKGLAFLRQLIGLEPVLDSKLVEKLLALVLLEVHDKS